MSRAKEILNVLSECGGNADQLYVHNPSVQIEQGGEERLLRFFRMPMSPGFLMENLIKDDRDLSACLCRILAKKMIMPVAGVPFHIDVDEGKKAFYQYLGERSCPTEVQLNITNRCVNRCRMCRKYEWDQIDMPLDSIKAICADLRTAGTERIILSGGEPLLHRDIRAILELMEGFRTIVFTSGTVPLSVEILEKIDEIQFSIDALDAELYRVIRGPGSIAIIKDNVRKARDAGCSATITTVLQRSNILHVPEIIDFCERERIPFVPSAVHSYDDLAFYDLSTRVIPPICMVPCRHCLIDPAGDVYVCCHHHEDNADYKSIDRSFILGNIFSSGFLNIWLSDRAVRVKRELIGHRASFCKGCYRYLAENDVASLIKGGGLTGNLPFIHTYFFPLQIAAPLRFRSGRGDASSSSNPS